MMNQRPAAANHLRHGAHRPFRCASDMRAVDLDAHRYSMGNIQLPAGVHTGRRFSEQHGDSTVEQTEGLASVVAYLHTKHDLLSVDADQIDTVGLKRRAFS